MHEILYTKEAQQRIAACNLRLQRRLKQAIERLASHPELGKFLTGHLHGIGSYRAGDYRILYRMEHQRSALLILTVGHRKDVYGKQ
ncbi:MAG: type II toxin-antitoxin system RelE/ParE family toxin [Candidatus Omnitrophica bacterium]|nr:type II toxin-antitoxin system RelE/ParE family toxin [Candidatus Omnitrophota bacterium]